MTQGAHRGRRWCVSVIAEAHCSCVRQQQKQNKTKQAHILAEEGADEAAKRHLIPNRAVAKGVQLRLLRQRVVKAEGSPKGTGGSTCTPGLPYLRHLNSCGSKAWCPMGCFFVRIPMESKRKAEGSNETTSLTEPIHRHVVTSFGRRPL
jgi:hypothetical protein